MWLNRLLLYFGIAVVDLDDVARALAAGILDTHDLATLNGETTVHELRRRYASIAVQTGLPLYAQRRVSDMAWRYIAEAQDKEPEPSVGRHFRFYT